MSANITGCDVKSERKYFLWKQALATVASSMLPFISGLALGISSVMLPQLRDDTTMGYDSTHESWIASIVALSMIIGSLCSGPIIDGYGRKLAHIIFGIPFGIGWIIISSANSTSIILVGRFLTGISAGANKSVSMVYIGEIADPSIRAIALFELNIWTPLGFWISHLMGYYLGWRTSSITFALISRISIVSFLFLKESPLWLISKGRTNEGIDTFRWFRGTEEKSEIELKTVLERHTEKPEIFLKDFLKVACSRAFIKPMFILMVVMTNCQLSGINAFGFYSQDIFKKIFADNINPFIMTMVMDCIRTLVSLVFCVIGSWVPRKLTCLIFAFGVTISASGVIVCFKMNIGFNNAVADNTLVWIPVLCSVMFIIAASATMTVGWTFVPELLPTSMRGLGTGLNSTCSFTFLFITVQILPDIMQKYDVVGLFAYFGTATLICGVILCFALPETNGKTLQSIEDSYRSKNVKLTVLK